MYRVKIHFIFPGGNWIVYDVDDLPRQFRPATNTSNNVTNYRFTMPKDWDSTVKVEVWVTPTFFPLSPASVWNPSWLGENNPVPGPWEWKSREYPGLMTPLVVRHHNWKSALGLWNRAKTKCEVMWEENHIALKLFPKPGDLIQWGVGRYATVEDLIREYRAQYVKQEVGVPISGNVQHWGFQNRNQWSNSQFEREVSRDAKWAPNLIIWGWMSNYAGPAHLAKPPLEEGEQTGCCLYKMQMHPRYKGIINSLKSLKWENPHLKVMPYVRAAPLQDFDTISPMINAARREFQDTADGFYLDEVGVRAYPDKGAEEVATFVNNLSERMPIVVEGANDLQIAPALISKAYEWAKGDYQTLRMGRLLQPYRQMIWGHSLGGHAQPWENQLVMGDRLGILMERPRSVWAESANL
jgi:hypothetical protein